MKALQFLFIWLCVCSGTGALAAFIAFNPAYPVF